MDDLLSAALCESGLGEFLCQTSPVPSTSGSYYDETSRDAPMTATTSATTTTTLANTSNINDFDAALLEDFFPSGTRIQEKPPECTIIPRVQVIPRKKVKVEVVKKEEPPSEVGEGGDVKQEVIQEMKQEEGEEGVKQEIVEDVKPLNVKVARTSDEHSSSPSPRILTIATAHHRSMTASPASSSTISNTNSQQASPAPVAVPPKVSPIGPIIKRTIHTRNGVQTQYLKPYINEQGQKIYRALNTVPATSVTNTPTTSNNFNNGVVRGNTVTLRGTTRPQLAGRQVASPMVNGAGGERIVMMRQEGPNGQQVLVKKVLSAASLDRQPGRGTTIVRGAPRGATTNLIIRNGSGRGTPLPQQNYRITNLVGRTTGGSTMMNHQLSRITRGGGLVGRGGVGGAGGVRYTTTRGPASPLHLSQSSPTFQYLDQTDGAPYTPIGGRPMVQRTIPRLAAGFDQADRQRMILSARSGGLASPRIVTPQFSQLAAAGTAPSMPALLTKSQKAKDEMKMAYQMGKEEAMVQRKNDLDDDDENLGYAETYSEYTPAKLRSGMAHPDSVVESASLSSVSPPDVRYQISIPEYLIDMGHISALQLEAVIYACQMHERRMPSGERYGYLIGDGAGVGKGRTVACIIFENYLQGRKRAIWLSVSSDLKFDAERDLRDVGAPNIACHALNKMKYAKISGKENGSIKKGCIFATYTSLIGESKGGSSKSKKYRSRIKQLIQWFGTDYDGVIILDECHRAKNLVPTAGAKPTKTGRMVLELQKALPNARVVYASATGATEPRNMAYMTRLGLWGERQAFPEFSDFISAVERRGVGAMEIVAMDMKQRGLYLARQLSFRGVSFAVQEVQLSADFVKMYDDAVKLWMEVRRQFQTVLENMDEEDRGQCKTVWGQFWACHQRFFKYLCIAAKVDTCVRLTRESIKAKKCVVIGLQSTGESATLETLEEMGGELNEFVSTAKAVLYGLIDKHFPSEGGSSGRGIFDDMDFGDRPAKRRKHHHHQDTLSFLGDYGSWTGATVGMSGRVGSGNGEQETSKKDDEENSTTSESSDDDKSDEDDDEEKSWDSAREEAEGARTLDDCEEDEWVKALLAEAESSSDSEEEEAPDDDEESRQAPEVEARDEPEEEFNPFMCDFANDDPWANKQQIIDEKPVVKTKSVSKKRKRVEEVESEEMKERRKRREERREKKIRRAARKAEREKKRRQEALQSRGNATDFISSSRLVGTGDEDKSNINPMLIKTELLAAVERLAPALPANTLDQLIDELGGPEFVAEMTGRRGHMVTNDCGDVMYQRRNANAEVSLELINMEEKEKFMRGEKLIAIISEAASSGISLQSDRRAINKRRRVHITLELPWSADKAIQQFGRTHRSNQVSGPEYVFLISELAGEKRFASVVAKRLESLGALTHGDRRATETRDLSQFNMDNKYGRVALDVLLKTVIGQNNPPLIDPPKDYKAGDFLEDMRLYMEGVGLLSRNKTNGQYIIEKEAATISKFLNRILGLPVHAQNALFVYFSEIVAELIAQSKHDGTYDTGIMDLGTGDDQVRKLETRFFLGRADNGSFRVEIHKIGVERGVSWDEALSLYKDHNTDEDGFYVCQPGVNGSGRKVAALVYGIGKVRMDNGARLYAITRPSTGRSPKLMIMADLKKRFSKVTVEEAEEIWKAQYDGAANMCQHNYIYGKCRTEAGGTYCEVGRRTRTYFVLSGSVLSVWPIVEEVLSGNDRKSSRMQVIRVRTEQDQKIVGLLVLPNHVRTLVQQLEGHCGRSIVKTDEN